MDHQLKHNISLSEWLQEPSRVPLYMSLALIPVSIIIISLLNRSQDNPDGLPKLSETIPYVSNTYQYMTNMSEFLQRATKQLESKKIFTFRLALKRVYMVTGARNVQAMFRVPHKLNSDRFLIHIMRAIWGATEDDLAKFAADKSGRAEVPAPGYEHMPEHERYYFTMTRVLHRHLVQTEETNKLAVLFHRFFKKKIEQFIVGEWSDEIGVLELLRRDMAGAAVEAVAGPKMIELTPNFLELLWEIDEVNSQLSWGPPKWLNRHAYNTRDRYCSAAGKFLAHAWENFDWNGPDADGDWDEIFGSRFMRELAKWTRDSGLSDKTAQGVVGIFGIYGSNANTIPMTTWCLMELVKDQELYKAIREEVSKVYTRDPKTGEENIDMAKLSTLPFLQGVYTEALRLHMSMHITRDVLEPVTLPDGTKLEPGSWIQAPTDIAHYDERIWGAEGHPASEFWPMRHIQYEDVKNPETGKVDKVPRFSMQGRMGDFFPFGGGISMCPGRFFAKQEMLLTLCMVVARFDIEFVRWSYLDKRPSDRPARNDTRWAGGAGMPPDRDMQVRLKRLW